MTTPEFPQTALDVGDQAYLPSSASGVPNGLWLLVTYIGNGRVYGKTYQGRRRSFRLDQVVSISRKRHPAWDSYAKGTGLS